MAGLEFRKRPHSDDEEAHANRPRSKIPRLASATPPQHDEASVNASKEEGQEDSNDLEEGEIVDDAAPAPKKKKKRLAPRGGKQWAQRHKGQAAARAARRAAREAAASGGKDGETSGGDVGITEASRGVITESVEHDGTSQKGVEGTPIDEEIKGMEAAIEALKSNLEKIKAQQQ